MNCRIVRRLGCQCLQQRKSLLVFAVVHGNKGEGAGRGAAVGIERQGRLRRVARAFRIALRQLRFREPFKQCGVLGPQRDGFAILLLSRRGIGFEAQQNIAAQAVERRLVTRLGLQSLRCFPGFDRVAHGQLVRRVHAGCGLGCALGCA